MTGHECNREKEVTTLINDMKWLKKTHFETKKAFIDSMKSMEEKLDVLMEIFHKGEGKITKLRQDIHGNGSIGLKKQTSNNADDIKTLQGQQTKDSIFKGTAQGLILIVWSIFILVINHYW